MLAAANIGKVSYSIMVLLKVHWKMERQENLPSRQNFLTSTYCPFVGKWMSPEPRNIACANSIRNLHKDWKKLELLLDMYKVYEGHGSHIATVLSTYLRDFQTGITGFTHYRWQVAGKIYPWELGWSHWIFLQRPQINSVQLSKHLLSKHLPGSDTVLTTGDTAGHRAWCLSQDSVG